MRVEKCDIIGLHCRFEYLLSDRWGKHQPKLSDLNNLFVIVLEFSRKIDSSTDLELNVFENVLKKDTRPFILQFVSSDGEYKPLFVKDYMETKFKQFSSMKLEFSFEKSWYSDEKSKEKVEIHFEANIFDWNILKTRETSQEPKNLENVISNVLSLRLANLFKGGIQALNVDRVLKSNCVDSILAFIDFPFDYTKAVELAWQFQRLDYLEILMNRDCPWPQNFDLKKLKPNDSRKFEKILEKNRNLHRKIAENDAKAVSKILDSEKGYKYAYNEFNESAFSTLFQNFSAEIYSILLEKRMKFCNKCKNLVLESPKEVKLLINDINFRNITQLKATTGDQPIISKCWLAVGHSNHKRYYNLVKKYFDELKGIPEILQLIKIAEKNSDLKIIFDFKNECVQMMNLDRTTTSIGTCNGKKTIQIAAKGKVKSEVLSTISHELAHLTMFMLYDSPEPYTKNDATRKEEFAKIVATCWEIQKNDNGNCFGNFNSIPEINIVFMKYTEQEFAGELIAQMFAVSAFYNHFPKNDLEKIKNVYVELYDYYYKYIVKDIEAYL